MDIIEIILGIGIAIMTVVLFGYILITEGVALIKDIKENYWNRK